MATPLHIRGTLIDCRLCLRTSQLAIFAGWECAAILMCLMMHPLGMGHPGRAGLAHPTTGVNPLG